MHDEEFKFLAATAYELSGIVLGEQKKELVYSRIARRIRALNLSSFAGYCEYLEQNKATEVSNFINSITTNLTSFFRENHHFEFLESKALDEIRQKHMSDRIIRIWSAGCSTGMEPYSIAMTCLNHMKLAGLDFKILATDLDSEVLAKAKAGIYSMDDVGNIQDKFKKYFEVSKDGQNARMKEQVKDIIQFNRLNLLGDWPMRHKFDVIFCRNVVIYFNKETQKELFSRYAEMLHTGGYLIIGHSESLHGVNERFKPMGRTIYQKVV
ncbi:MAG: protein-glutamate O-methyltransferase CheR [Oceanospirillaceae bacterium]|nr:protein-glutamate O-methyltransferase CheR [Oceanospirillaceae bacterium]MCP5350079.1 protein-glutamate O-methyltransferase CheR [Oceanospirillaceae bacterium]